MRIHVLQANLHRRSSQTAIRALLFTASVVLAASLAAAPKRHPGLQIIVSASRVIDRYQGSETDANKQTHHFCGLIKARDGHLIALYGLRPDQLPPRNVPLAVYLKKDVGYRLSSDDGQEWSRQRELDYAGNKGGCLFNGTILIPSYYTLWVNNHELRMIVQRSKDAGITWREDQDVRVSFPAGRTLSRIESGRSSFYFWGNVVALDRATVVATMYGQFADTTQFRSILIRSHDEGHSWQFVSCIAGDKPSGSGGFTEPSLVRLANGNLLCVMRTEYHEPRILEQCRSNDEGKTWTDPSPAPGIPGVGPADRHYTTPDGVRAGFNAGNVSPMLALLDNGVLALAYGRPGLKVAFSSDGTGNRWDRIIEIVPKGFRYSYSRYDVTTGMAGLVPVGPDRLLLLYDVYSYARRPRDRRANTIFTRTLTVRR